MRERSNTNGAGDAGDQEKRDDEGKEREPREVKHHPSKVAPFPSRGRRAAVAAG